MIRFALTGASGLLGGNVLFEIIKNNLEDLDNIEIFWLGRGNDAKQSFSRFYGLFHDLALSARIRKTIRNNGWQYFSTEYNEDLIERVCEHIIPIEVDLLKDDLEIEEKDYRLLAESKIDYFFHIAALTDFRNSPAVIRRLKETNIQGTKRLLTLLDSLPHKVGNFAVISSAYTCGKTYGLIKPDYINFNQEFRNPYEKSKLEAECACREYCQEKRIPLKVFRPSTLAGRIIEKPIGFVTKYDVYLAWIKFFVGVKAFLLPTENWEEIYTLPIDLPIRLSGNKNTGLNIVASDLCAKIIYKAVVNNYKETNYHLVSQNDLKISEMVNYVLGSLNINGWSTTPQLIETYNNKIEDSYYKTVGPLFTPYVIQETPMIFDCTSMKEICYGENIPAKDIDSVDNLSLMVEFAKKNNFGLDIELIKKNKIRFKDRERFYEQL